LSAGLSPAFVSAQIGDSINSLEKHYYKFINASVGTQLAMLAASQSETFGRRLHAGVHKLAREKTSPTGFEPPRSREALVAETADRASGAGASATSRRRRRPP